MIFSSDVALTATLSNPSMRADERASTSRMPARWRTLLVSICALIATRTPHAAASGYGSRAERTAPKIVTGSDSGPPLLRAFTWGIGGERVGRPSNPSKLPPAMVELSVNAVAIAASGHTVLVDDTGYVYTAGRNSSAGGGGRGSPPIEDSGQLGRGGNPSAMERVLGKLNGEVVVSAGAGRYHTVVATESGKVFTFGLNDAGQLGAAGIMGVTPTTKVTCDSGGNCDGLMRKTSLVREGESCYGGAACRIGVPTQIKFGNGSIKFKSVAAGRYCGAAVSDAGAVYVWGLNSCANNAAPNTLLKDAQKAAAPRLVQGVSGVVKVDIGYTNMIFQTKDGGVYTCDTGFNGYAQVEPKAKVELVRHQDFLTDQTSAADVAAGRCHFVVATKKGAVYTWGCGSSALGREGDRERPAPVRGDMTSRVATHVAAGEYFTLINTKEGVIYGMGSGGNGNLGVQPGGSNDISSPVRVNVNSEVGTARAIAAGYQHSVAILELYKL